MTYGAHLVLSDLVPQNFQWIFTNSIVFCMHTDPIHDTVLAERNAKKKIMLIKPTKFKNKYNKLHFLEHNIKIIMNIGFKL